MRSIPTSSSAHASKPKFEPINEVLGHGVKRGRTDQEDIIIDKKLHKFIERVTAKCKRRECVVSEYDPEACKRLRKKLYLKAILNNSEMYLGRGGLSKVLNMESDPSQVAICSWSRDSQLVA
ncbi:hypothetical protein ACHWQZ_G004112 [Mnemiopsis leidyi]